MRNLIPAVSIACLLLFVFYALDRLFQSVPATAYRFDVTLDQQKLPQRWIHNYGEFQVREYSFEFEGLSYIDKKVSLYFPGFEQRLSIRLNGASIVDSQLERGWLGPLSTATAFIDVPAGLIRSGINSLDISVESGPAIMGAITPFFLDEKEKLNNAASLRRVIGMDAMGIAFGIQFFLLFVCLIAFVNQSKERSFGWIIITLLPSTLFSIGYFAPYWPYLYELLPFFFALSIPAILALQGLAYVLSDQSPPKIVSRLILFFALSMSTFAFFAPEVFRLSILQLMVPAILIIIAVNIILTIRSLLKAYTQVKSLFLIGLILILAGMIHDLLLRQMIIEGVMLWSNSTRSVVYIAIVIYLLGKLTRRAEQESKTKALIEERLMAQEKEMNSIYQQQMQNAEIILLNNERARLLRELHDGVAGQLTVIASLTGDEQRHTTSIQEIAKSALTDLRMVVSTLAVKDCNLMYILATFREKYLSPLERAGVKVVWNMHKAPNPEGFSSIDALNLIRILQEALNNALKHGKAYRIIVSAELVDNTVTVLFENEGTEFFKPESTGYGVHSIEARARELGAQVDVRATEQGALFSFSLKVVTDNKGDIRVKKRSEESS